MRILIAPDSFKETASASEVAAALAAGWSSVRPQDSVITLPLADGGEGSAAAIWATDPNAEEIRCTATGPDGRPVSAGWLLLTDGTAVVELAAASGLPQMRNLDPLGAQTDGFGELLAAAARHPRVQRIVATVGGSAATDGGAGALSALGARFLDADGHRLPAGGWSLSQLATVDLTELTRAPSGGVEVLTDVTAPLLGRRGAAAVFGPQKGAGADDVVALDAALTRLARVIGGHPDQCGAGAAGGTAFGLATLWGADLVPGAARIGALTGLPAALADADLLITGEGQFDGQSTTGKVVGYLLESVAHQRVLLVTGQLGAAPPDRAERTVELSVLAGSSTQAMQHTAHWLTRAGAELAGQLIE